MLLFKEWAQYIHNMIMPSSKFICFSLRRRGSRINTDRFPKQALKAHATHWEIFWILTLQVPFPGFLSHSEGIWPDFYLEIFIFIKVYLFIKNLTNFRKTMETGVDPCLLRPSPYSHLPMKATYLTDTGSPFRVIARIIGCIICSPAAVHHDISHSRIGWISIWNLSLLFFGFFYFRKSRLHVVSRRYKHVWCTPAFVWHDVQFNLVITMKNFNGESSLFSLLSLQMHLRFWLKSLRLSPELRRWSWAVCQPICSSLPILCPQQLLESWDSLKQTLLMAESSLTLECFVLKLNKDTNRQVSQVTKPNPSPKQNIHNIELRALRLLVCSVACFLSLVPKMLNEA